MIILHKCRDLIQWHINIVVLYSGLCYRLLLQTYSAPAMAVATSMGMCSGRKCNCVNSDSSPDLA